MIPSALTAADRRSLCWAEWEIQQLKISALYVEEVRERGCCTLPSDRCDREEEERVEREGKSECEKGMEKRM
jgi:hypothetical protein